MININIIKDLVDWINDNLEQPLSIKVVASKSGYSQWYLQRLFKSITGNSIATYIRTLRLNRAALELKQGRETITEIACKYQFESHQSFTRAFKKMFSVTPSDYRRK